MNACLPFPVCGRRGWRITAAACAAIAMLVGAGNAIGQDGQASSLNFTDVSRDTGLRGHVAGIQAHAAAWADLTGDDRPELFVGTWGMRDLRNHANYRAPGPPVPGRLYYNIDGQFVYKRVSGVDVGGEATAAVFADFNNDGNTDLYISNHSPDERNQLFRNNGDGRFTEIGDLTGACPGDRFRSRSVGVMDYNGDGLLDLLVIEGDREPKRSRLYRNNGELKFENVTAQVGLPTDIAGLGVAVGDLTGNGAPDFIVTTMNYSRLFLNDGEGRFTEQMDVREITKWRRRTLDDKPCGVALCDLNRDGRLDVIIGHHDKRPWRHPKAIMVLLNEGMSDGEVGLRDITEEAGFAPLGTKAPHVAGHDFDNDGWPDVYVSIVVRKPRGVQPVIYEHQGIEGMKDGIPRFRAPALSDVDFPQPHYADMDVHQVNANAPLRYFGFGPVADFDRDGRLDMALVSWWPRLNSYLLRNVSDNDNHYLRIDVRGRDKLNRSGIGAKVAIYEAGALGERGALLGYQEIRTGYGYGSGQETIAHFGLGDAEQVDVRVQLPHDGPTIDRAGVRADRTLIITEPRAGGW